MFWNIVLGVASFFLNLVLSPKPQSARPASLADFNVPVAEEGVEIPVAFGTVNIRSPNVVWYGDLVLQPIKGPRRYGLFGPRVTLGYRYGLGMHMVLCHAVQDEIREIWAGGKQIFPKPTTAAPFEGTGVILIDQMDIFGGDEGEGGIFGSVHVLSGGPNQTQDGYLAAHLAGADTPAFRGVVSLVWEHLYIGNSPYIKPWEIVLKRIHKTSRNATQWYDAKAEVPDSHSSATATGVELQGSATMNQEYKLDSNGQYVAYAENYFLKVWHLPDGAEQVFEPTLSPGQHGVGASVHITEYDEVLIRYGGNNFASAHTSLQFRLASDIGVVAQSIDIHSIVATYGFDLNHLGGFVASERGGWLLLKILPSVYPGLPWILLQRVGDSWSVSAHHGGSNAIGAMSLGPTYAYCRRYSSSTSVVRVTWSGGWAETSIDLSAHTGGANVTAIHYHEGSGEVVVYAGGGIYVFSPDLSTLLRSATGYLGGPVNSKRMSDGSSVVRLEQDLPTTSRIRFVSVSDLTVTRTIDVLASSYVHKTSGWNRLVFNPDAGGLVLGVHLVADGSTVFWPTSEAGFDMNPAHIIRECLTDRTWGMGYAAADIDDDSFTAAADTLWDECFGLSLLWTREERIEEFISTILAHIDAYLYLRRTTGKFTLKLIRNDYDIDTIPVFDEDDVVSWDEVARREPAEAVNEVIVKYTDRRNRGLDASTSFPNIAQIQQIGERIGATRFYPGISRGALATRVAARDQRSLGVGMISGRLTGKRTWDALYPGDPFRLVSARHNLDGEVMRVAALKFGDGRDNKIGVKFIQDVFRLNADELVDMSQGDWENPTNPPAIVSPRLVWEMPYYELVETVGSSDATTLLAGDPDAGMIQASGAKPSGDALDAAIWVDGVKEEVMTFAPAGLLDADIGAFETSITLTDATDLTLIEVGMLAAIGNTPETTEIVRIDAVSGNDLTISRGMLDTIPQAHSLGDALIVYDDFGMSDFEQRTDGDTPDVQLLTRTASGSLSSSIAPTDTVTLDSRAIRPLRPANCEIEGDGVGPVDISGIDPFAATWARRNRLTETVPSAWTDSDVTPEGGQTTTLILTDEFGTTIDNTTYSGISGASQNIDPDDFGAVASGYVIFDAVRDGYTAWQPYRIRVLLAAGLLTTGDEQSGTDQILLSGDMQSGSDTLRLSGNL